MDNVTAFFQQMIHDFDELERNQFSNDLRILEKCANNLENHLHALSVIILNVEEELQHHLVTIFHLIWILFERLEQFTFRSK